MSRFSILICLSTYLLTGAKAALNAEGISGGDDAFLDMYNYQIYLEPDGKNFCGGSIIGDQHILTAAHCVAKNGVISTYNMRVTFGVFDMDHINSRVFADYVKKIYIPREYNSSIANADIAVLKLNNPLDLDYNPYLRKLELPEEGRSYAGENATITGYGYTWGRYVVNPEDGKKVLAGGQDSFKRKFAITDVLSTDQCQSDWPERRISEEHICARVHQRNRTEGVTENLCSGDSGGPLVHNNSVVIGVVSFGKLACSESTTATIYTRVSSFLDFVKNAMADRVTSSMLAYEHTTR